MFLWWIGKIDTLNQFIYYLRIIIYSGFYRNNLMKKDLFPWKTAKGALSNYQQKKMKKKTKLLKDGLMNLPHSWSNIQLYRKYVVVQT